MKELSVLEISISLWFFSIAYSSQVFPCSISFMLLPQSSGVASTWLSPWSTFSLHLTWLLQDLSKSITSSSFILFIWLLGHLVFLLSYWLLFLSHIFWLSIFSPNLYQWSAPKLIPWVVSFSLMALDTRYVLMIATYVFILAFTPKRLAHKSVC